MTAHKPVHRLPQTLFLMFARLLLALAGWRTAGSHARWRPLSGETFIMPYGQIYARTEFKGRVRLAHHLLRPWAALLGRRRANTGRKTGKVSGVYYPIN